MDGSSPFCRVCFAEGARNIFQRKVANDEQEWSVASVGNIAEKLQYVTMLMITEHDGLSLWICELCIVQLNVAYNFKRRAVDSHRKSSDLLAASERSFVNINNAITHDEETLESYIDIGPSIKLEPFPEASDSSENCTERTTSTNSQHLNHSRSRQEMVALNYNPADANEDKAFIKSIIQDPLLISQVIKDPLSSKDEQVKCNESSPLTCSAVEDIATSFAKPLDQTKPNNRTTAGNKRSRKGKKGRRKNNGISRASATITNQVQKPKSLKLASIIKNLEIDMVPEQLIPKNYSRTSVHEPVYSTNAKKVKRIRRNSVL